jgi:hypothetical protein
MRSQVLEALRDDLAATRTQMLLLGRMSAAEKFASFLPRSPASRRARRLPMTRSDIADYLGFTIETVSRKLNELRLLGVIRRVRLTDLDRIEAIAEAGLTARRQRAILQRRPTERQVVSPVRQPCRPIDLRDGPANETGDRRQDGPSRNAGRSRSHPARATF